MVTKEELIKKLAELEANYTQQQANLNALQGAIQFCKHLIETETEKETPDGVS